MRVSKRRRVSWRMGTRGSMRVEEMIWPKVDVVQRDVLAPEVREIPRSKQHHMIWFHVTKSSLGLGFLPSQACCLNCLLPLNNRSVMCVKNHQTSFWTFHQANNSVSATKSYAASCLWQYLITSMVRCIARIHSRISSQRQQYTLINSLNCKLKSGSIRRARTQRVCTQ